MLTLALAVVALGNQGLARTIEVPFRIAEDAIIVDATVNGKKVALMFDTGYGGTVVLNDSINVGPVTGTQGLQDFVGTLEAKTAALKTMSIGGKTVNPEGKDIVLMPLNDMSFSYGVHTDGILGLEAVRDYVMEINFEQSKFIFHPDTVDISARQPDNKRTFLQRMLPIGGSAIKLEVSTKSGGKMILGLDTGNAFYATTHKDVLQRIGAWPQNREPKYIKLSGVASGTVESWYKRMEDLVIYGVPVKSSVWSIIDLPSSSSESDGTVGFGFLRNFNIVLDYKRRRVWMENWTGKVDSERTGDIGISAAFDPRRKRIRVFRVSPESPAALAGIQEGDDILSVDGKELLDIGFRGMEQLLQGPVGSKVRLAVSRNGLLTRYEIERKSLVNEPES